MNERIFLAVWRGAMRSSANARKSSFDVQPKSTTNKQPIVADVPQHTLYQAYIPGKNPSSDPTNMCTPHNVPVGLCPFAWFLGCDTRTEGGKRARTSDWHVAEIVPSRCWKVDAESQNLFICKRHCGGHWCAPELEVDFQRPPPSWQRLPERCLVLGC